MDLAREYDNGRLYERKKACCMGILLIPDNVIDWDCSCVSCVYYTSIIESCQKNSVLLKINKEVDKHEKVIVSLEEAIDKNRQEIKRLLAEREKIYSNASLIESLSNSDKHYIETTLKRGSAMFTVDGVINIIERFPENMERYDIIILVLKSSVVINITTLCKAVQDFVISIVKCDSKDYRHNSDCFIDDSIIWRRIHSLRAVPRNSYPDGCFDNAITIVPWREV